MKRFPEGPARGVTPLAQADNDPQVHSGRSAEQP